MYSFYKLRLLRIASCTVPASNVARICCPACHPVRSPARTPGEELLNFAATKCYNMLQKHGPEFAFCERGQRFCIWYILVLTWYWPGNAGRCWSIFRKDFVNSWLRAAGPSDVSEVLGQALLVTATTNLIHSHCSHCSIILEKKIKKVVFCQGIPSKMSKVIIIENAYLPAIRDTDILTELSGSTAARCQEGMHGSTLNTF